MPRSRAGRSTDLMTLSGDQSYGRPEAAAAATKTAMAYLLAVEWAHL